MRSSDRIKFVAGLVLLFAGLDLLILLSHMSRWTGIPLILAGLGLLYWASRTIRPVPDSGVPAGNNLASSIIQLLTLNGRFPEAIPLYGIGVLASVLGFNLLIAPEFRLGSNDYVGLLLAGVLLSHNLLPEKYSAERDFALLFGVLLFLLLVLPTTALELTSQGEDTNSILTYYLLALPTASFARLLGIPAVTPGMNPTTNLPAYNYIDLVGPNGAPLSVSIGLSCSGLYSVAIFVSAFFAFVAVEYRKVDRKVINLLAVGVLLAWAANILRMTIIVIVGRYYGRDTMYWVHNNIGEFIFMAWVSLFWLFMFRYFGVLDRPNPAGGGAPPGSRRRGRCGVCGQPLSPAIPARRCECGAVSHAGCILTNDNRCPACGVEFPNDGKPTRQSI